MRNKLVFFTFCFTFFSTVGFTQQSIDFYKFEHQKKLLDQASEQTYPAASTDDYSADKNLVVDQLKLITENEDLSSAIVVGDELRISFQDRSQVQKAIYRVSEKGEIFMPLIGVVKIENLNRKQARELINTLLTDYIRNPKLELDINAEGKFIIVGAVRRPGVEKYQPNLTIMEALLNASYDKDRANLRSVMLIRGQQDKPIIMRLDLNKMIKRGDRSDNIALKPGDIIHVPTSFINNFNTFKNAILGYIMDYYTLGGGEILKN